MLEKWTGTVDKKKIFGTLLTDLLKTCDGIGHDLLIAILNGHGLSLSASEPVHDCLLNRKLRKKFGYSKSSLEEILAGVPQGSILG